MADDKTFLQLKKWHLIIGVIFLVGSQAVSMTSAYYSKETAVKEMVQNVQLQLAAYKLESEKRFVKKDDFAAVATKIDNIETKVNIIEGYLQNRPGP